MTYGWAILIIAIVLVALFSLNLFNPYTFSPKASPGSCQILRPNGQGSNLFVSAVGPTCTTNEIPQYVASFNGGTSYISTTYPASSYPNGFTYCAWFNSVNTGSGAGNYIFAQIGGSDYIDLGLFEPKLRWEEYLAYPVGNDTIAKIAPVASAWNFACGAYNTNNQQQTAYLNGIAITSPAPYTNSSDPYVLYIGTRTPNAGYFYGDISNAQVYNISLSPSAVNTLYAEGIGGAPIDLQNLVGWWPLNGNSNDYSGNGNNGVPTGVVFTSNWESGYTTP